MISPRVVLLTEIISPYRIPVFNVLARSEKLNLHVIFLAETDTSLRQWRVYKDEILFSYEVLPSWRWRSRNNNVLLNRGLWAALNRTNPQVVICGGYNYPASWAALWWAHRRNVKFVLWSESNRQDRRSGRAWVEKWKRYFVRRCDAFLVPGKSSLTYLRDLGAAEPNITTAPNAVDNEYFEVAADKVRAQECSHRERLGLPVRFLLFVGRLVPEKGVFDLLHAYARLETDLRSKIGLVFAGDGTCRGELVKQAQEVSPGTMCFPGFLQREDLAILYSLAEGLILPTHSDPWGLVVNEAMVCGAPIIVTDVAGCTEDLVEDGWNGYVVPREDPERLSAAIRQLVQQPELRKQMSTRSRERIRHYSPDECAGGFLRVVTSLCKEAS